MANRKHWEKQYEKPLKEIPWEIEKPPKELVRVLQRGLVKPCKALDVACGTGNYSLFLAKKRFRVTGIDLSRNALRIARKKAESAKQKIRFAHADVFSLASVLHQKFDFILDYSLLHHLPRSKTRTYAKQLIRLLNPGGKLLLVCYSEKDSKGKKTKQGEHGNLMYYRTKREIEDGYKPLELFEYAPVKLGKRQHHRAHFFLFKKPL